MFTRYARNSAKKRSNFHAISGPSLKGFVAKADLTARALCRNCAAWRRRSRCTLNLRPPNLILARSEQEFCVPIGTGKAHNKRRKCQEHSRQAGTASVGVNSDEPPGFQDHSKDEKEEGRTQASSRQDCSGQDSRQAVPTTIVSAPVGLDAFKAIAQSSLDAIPTGFCVCTADCSLVRYNKRAVELWGRELPLGEPAARYSGDLRRYRPDGAPLHFDSTPVAQAISSGARVMAAELVIEQPDGTRVPVLMNVQPIKDHAGRVEGAVCSFQELTERKRVEEALRASAAELQSVINRTPFMLVRMSRDLRYRFVSDAYAHLLGQPRSAIVGKTNAELLGEKGLATLRPYIERVLKGEAVNFECNLEYPNIGTRRLLVAYRPELGAKGKAVGWIASLLDVTEQRRVEAAMSKRADEQAALYRFTDRLYRAASLNDVYEATLDNHRRRAGLPTRLDPALRYRWRHAICRLARLVRRLSCGHRRPFAVEGR